MINLSESEMLKTWKRIMHIDTVRRECTIERDDGIDIDDLLINRLRQWYAHLLLTAPIELLPIEDLRAEVAVTADEQGVVTATLPERCVRPVEWQLAGWSHAVTHFAEPGSAIDVAQRSRWTRFGSQRPVAVKHDNHLLLYSIMPGITPTITQARCVAMPTDNRYLLHRDAMATLPGWEQSTEII